MVGTLDEPGFYHKDRLTGVAGRLRNVEVFLLAETEMKTEISEDDFANAQNEGGIWRPRRDLNPCYRRERPTYAIFATH